MIGPHRQQLSLTPANGAGLALGTVTFLLHELPGDVRGRVEATPRRVHPRRRATGPTDHASALCRCVAWTCHRIWSRPPCSRITSATCCRPSRRWNHLLFLPRQANAARSTPPILTLPARAATGNSPHVYVQILGRGMPQQRLHRQQIHTLASSKGETVTQRV